MEGVAGGPKVGGGRRWSRRRAVPLVFTLATSLGCAKVKSHSTVETIPVREQVTRTAIPGSVHYEVAASTRGTTIELDIEQARRCEIVTSQIGRKVRHTVRSLESDRMSWGPAYSFAMAGI